MLSQLGHAPRFVRLTVLVTVVILVPTLYILYPSPEYVPSPGEVQAGGIDSEHWREPIQPDLNLGVKDYRGSGTEHEREQEQEYVREWQDGAADGRHDDQHGWKGVSEETLSGGVIMPKLGNETAKAELGRSAWRVLHLMTLRYPDEPTEDDRHALKSYFHLFSRLYPCGECAAEFQKLLKEYPPQTSSRKTASLWLCHVHNLVNERLGKPEFDCLTLDATYDCGCGDESASATTDGQSPEETGISPGVGTDAESEVEVERADMDQGEIIHTGADDGEHAEVPFGPHVNSFPGEAQTDPYAEMDPQDDRDRDPRPPQPHGHELEIETEEERDYVDRDDTAGSEDTTATAEDGDAFNGQQGQSVPDWDRGHQGDDWVLDGSGRDDDGIDDKEEEVRWLGGARGQNH
ncbi:thiol oxidase [Kwoniella heveanensis CBS 569]|nr:thiol oxidase [Kwoniella heveanensis CBS 569]